MDFDITAYVIERCRERFVKDGNPLHVWEAYRISRRRVVPTLGPGGLLSTIDVAPATVPMTPLPIPEWVARYLDECADGLLSGEDPTDALLMRIKGGHGGLYGPLVNLERDGNIVAFIDNMMSLEPADAVEVVKNMALDRDEIDDLVVVLRHGRPTVDRVCQIVASITERTGNPFSSKPLSYDMVRSSYYRLKDDV